MARIDRLARGVSSPIVIDTGAYVEIMRYADGGGLSAQGRAKREAVRLQAAEWFAQDVPVAEIAHRLRVSTNAVYVWRRRWQSGGETALASKGPGGSACRLDDARRARLARALEAGPAAHGFTEDQRWTLARIADLIARIFHIRYTLRGVSYLLHRMGFSPQRPAHQALERDEAAIATWRRESWPAGKP
jgi:transposase